jgi:hypothetical protein
MATQTPDLLDPSTDMTHIVGTSALEGTKLTTLRPRVTGELLYIGGFSGESSLFLLLCLWFHCYCILKL